MDTTEAREKLVYKILEKPQLSCRDKRWLKTIYGPDSEEFAKFKDFEMGKTEPFGNTEGTI